MDWKSHARHWLEEAARIPNGERAIRLDAYAREIADVAPGTLRKYVRALIFLEEVKQAARRRTGHQTTRTDMLLDDLSANEIRDLEHVQRYGRDHFDEVVEQVLGGLRKDRIRLVWNMIRIDANNRVPNLQPRNVNEFRVTNRIYRPAALRAAAACVGEAAGPLTILPDAQTLAPFQADAVIVGPGRPASCTGFRHLGDTGRPGLASRAGDMVTASLAAARAFATFYVVVQAVADAEEVHRRLAPVGPCGVGVIRYDAATGKAMLLTTGKLRRSKRGLDLDKCLANLLSAERVITEPPID